MNVNTMSYMIDTGGVATGVPRFTETGGRLTMVYSQRLELARRAIEWLGKTRQAALPTEAQALNVVTALDIFGIFNANQALLGHLRMLLERDPLELDAGHGGGRFCGHCRQAVRQVPPPEGVGFWTSVIDHATDCPYVAAKAFVESLSTCEQKPDGPSDLATRNS